MSEFSGIRRHNNIANELKVNFDYLEKTQWKLFDEIRSVLVEKTEDKTEQIEKEKTYAELIQSNLKGFGPKQARNLLQILGFTVYEIPIDSRIGKWLNEFGFPIKISAIALQDKNYYNLISDGINNLCERANIKPCLFDAAAFIAGDKGKWTKENSIF